MLKIQLSPNLIWPSPLLILLLTGTNNSKRIWECSQQALPTYCQPTANLLTTYCKPTANQLPTNCQPTANHLPIYCQPTAKQLQTCCVVLLNLLSESKLTNCITPYIKYRLCLLRLSVLEVMQYYSVPGNDFKLPFKAKPGSWLYFHVVTTHYSGNTNMGQQPTASKANFILVQKELVNPYGSLLCFVYDYECSRSS